jgi:hypothetical protein
MLNLQYQDLSSANSAMINSSNKNQLLLRERVEEAIAVLEPKQVKLVRTALANEFYIPVRIYFKPDPISNKDQIEDLILSQNHYGQYVLSSPSGYYYSAKPE